MQNKIKIDEKDIGKPPGDFFKFSVLFEVRLFIGKHLIFFLEGGGGEVPCPKPRPSFKGNPKLNAIAYRPVLSFLKLCMCLYVQKYYYSSSKKS